MNKRTHPVASRWARRLVMTQIAVQIGMALTPFYVTTVQAASYPEADDAAARTDALPQASHPGAFEGFVSQQASAAATQEVQAWMSQFGTARVELGTDRHLKPQSGSADVLIPISKSESRILFTQNGIRSKDGQMTANLGVGQRHFTGEWMLGYNAFYDHNLSEGHKRLGLGAEAWRDNLKFSANGYARLSGWKRSSLEDYDARAANGFDVRAEAWLPTLPSVGGRLMYEKYYGDEVALFGKEKRQKDADAVTAGVSYTPVPLVSFSADHKAGGSQSETAFGLQLSWKLGEPLAKQLDASAVAASRTLSGSGLDLVERNNNIVLEYRKQELIRLTLPKEISGVSGGIVPVSYGLNSKYGLSRIVWNDAALKAAGGKVQDMGGGKYQIVLPKYVANSANNWPLSAVAYDTRNNASGVASTVVNVSRPAVSLDKSDIAATPATILANGSDNSELRITLRDADGQPITGMSGALTATLQETQSLSKKSRVAQAPVKAATLSSAREQSNGIYLMTLTAGTRPGSVSITPSIDGAALKAVTVAQVSDTATAVVSDGDLTMTADSAAANGVALNRAQAKVTDSTGNSVAGVAVTFSLSGSAQAQGNITVVSDDKGLAALSFSDVVAEAVTVTAATANGGSAKTQAHFVADGSTAGLDKNDLTVDRVSVLADGKEAATFRALVKDAKGNPVAGLDVKWSSNAGNLSGSTSKTDANGYAQVSLRSTQAGNVQVAASINNSGVVNAPVVNFSADAGSAVIGSGDLTADKTTALANGSELVTYTALVKDANGNVLDGQTVNWTTTLGGLSNGSSVTDSNGKATITLSSTAAGVAQVTAAVGSSAAASAPQVQFTADGSTAVIGSGDLTVNKTAITANGSDAATYTAIVKDANGNLVAGQTVNWITDLGNLSGATSVTDQNGVAKIALTGAVAGVAQVKASVNGGSVNAPTVQLKPDEATAVIGAGDLTANKTVAVANGTEQVTYTALVQDANGNVVVGLNVSWSSNLGDLAGSTSVTDANGKATMTLSSLVAGNAVLAARPGSGSSVNAPAVSFTADGGTASIGAGDLNVDKTTVVANNVDKATYTALVKDANGNPLVNYQVNWSTDRGNLSGSSSMTDSSGKAVITLSGTQSGTASVTANVNGNGTNAAVVNLVGDATTAKVATVASNKAIITANGSEDASLTATVTDANGNKLSGVSVSWSTSLGNLSASASDTDVNGNAVIGLNGVITSRSNGVANVIAAINGSSGNKNVTLRTVFQVGGKFYWTQNVNYPQSTESGANAACLAHGGGRVINRSDVSNFISNGGDFAQRSTSGEYANTYYYVGGEWTVNSVDLHSEYAGLGDFHPVAGYPPNAYVCIK